MTEPLLFTPHASSLTPGFWHALTQLKLHVLKLDDAPVPITASYGGGRFVNDRKTGQQIGLNAGFDLGEESFSGADGNGTGNASDKKRLSGKLHNFNTIEDFKNADKTALLSSVADSIWRKINAGPSAEITAEDLNSFIVVTFADLKKYRYWYWCGFPSLLQKPGWETVSQWQSIAEDTAEVIEAREELKQLGTFALSKVVNGQRQYSPLHTWSTFFADIPESERTLIFLDPSSGATSPGWPLRNVLHYLTLSHGVSSLRLLALREATALTVDLRLKVEGSSESKERPAVVGWEKNDKGKLGPKMADLAPLMDPTRLADQAVDLNLQLMKWRIMPELDLEKVKNTKCLLLGAGTLGCYVARTLMAWGVRHITLVDSSTVSFSNPVRQPLFEFEDSLGGGKPKGEAAAASLRRIYPGVESKGISLSIPMPGHPISAGQEEQTQKDVETLEKLIVEHDVVYLLMDSRESRWLPTVIGASKRKLVMNVALGFDTFLVMRHGVPTDTPVEAVQVKPGQPYEGRLGCYYCNDIVAPTDSLTDRTLDQMCTVTRPGIASIASSTAVELMVSVLQHPKGIHAHSDVPIAGASNATERESSETASPLGIVPHQIRGYLAQFNNLKITGQAYDRCTGCSDRIVKAYESEGFEMLKKAFEDAKYLEKLAGLEELFKESEELMESVDWAEEGEDSDGF